MLIFLVWIDDVPVGLHVYNRPAFCICLIQSDVKLADVGVPVIGPFPDRVGVVYVEFEGFQLVGIRPAELFQITVGVSRSEYWLTSDESVDPNGLSSLVVDEVNFG